MGKFGDDETARLKEALKQAEERNRLLFQNHPDPMIVSDMDGIILSVNKSLYDHTGYSADEIVGIRAEDSPLIRGLDPRPRDAFLREINESGSIIDFEAEYNRADGTKVPCLASGRIVEFDNRRMIVSILRDISEKKAAERILLESERLYRETFKQSPAVKLLVDPRSLAIIDANEAAATFYGYSIDRMKSMRMMDISASDEAAIKANIGISARGEESRFVYRHRLASGELRDVEVYAGLIDLGGHEVLHSIIHDITDKVRAEEELKKLVAEKETLMKELQHRVKNNLGVVSGLLSLSAGKVKDEEALRAFEAAVARIESISGIYAKLYGTKDLTNIELGGYAQDLVRSLFSTYNLDPDRISLKASFGETFLDLKRSVPFGLIMNELVTNALKYAYPPPGSGEIRVELGVAEGKIRLVVADDGPGLPERVLRGESDGLGMTLVRMLSGQLGAELAIDCSGGTRIEIAFDAEARPE